MRLRMRSVANENEKISGEKLLTGAAKGVNNMIRGQLKPQIPKERARRKMLHSA